MRIKALFFALLSLFTFASTVHAQIFEPVKWKFSLGPIENNEADVIASATIESKWHVYALTVSADPNAIGPIPTSLKLTPSPSFSLVGKTKQGKFITHYDPNFEMDLNYFENKATFTQRIKIKDTKGFQLKGNLEYMACNDERCIFPDPEMFTLKVGNEEATPAEEPKPAEESKGILKPVKWSARLEKINDTEFDVIYTATMDAGWHIYAQVLSNNEGPVPTSFTFGPMKGVETVGKTIEGKPIRKYDPNFMMDLDYFEGKAEFRQRLKLTEAVNTPYPAVVNFMVCDEESCLPPKDVHFSIDFAKGTVSEYEPKSDLQGMNKGSGDPFQWSQVDLNNPYSTCGIDEGPKSETSLWAIFLFGIIGGLLALVTPCVFPMIPLTVSFFTKGSEGGKGKQRAILYGAFILLIYFLLSLPFHLSKNVDPEVLNTISTNVWLNLAFFAIFIVFAISFFGFYEIQLPSSFANKVDNASNVGGLIGIFFMALTLAIVSFSCTGPILGTVIGSIYASDAAGVVQVFGLELSLPATKISMAMLGFGLALGLPFGLFAAFPSMMKKLPKSGGWLEDFKVSLGFLEVAFALKFLSNADLVEQWGFLKREFFFGAWIIIGILWALYLFGKFKFKPGQGSKKLSKTKLAVGLFVLGFAIRMVPGILPPGQLNKFQFLSGFPPPRDYSVYEFKPEFVIYHDLAEAMKAGKEQNKPVFVDFTGWACVNCRKMEETVWPKDKIAKIFSEGYIMCSLYVDEKVELPADQQFVYTTADGRQKEIRTVGNKWATLQTQTFNNNSQPFYAILATDSTLLAPTMQYNPNVDEYHNWLDCGLNSYKTWKEKTQLASN
ncbi:MAG: protein-disulfide reductase DsbD family protein [Flavobacteriales bacterium]